MGLMFKPRGSSTSSFVCLSKFSREFGDSFSKFTCRDYCKHVKIYFSLMFYTALIVLVDY